MSQEGPALPGECHVMYAYDIAQAIDLEAVARAVRDPSTSGRLVHTHPAPSHFQFTPPPLRVAQKMGAVHLGRWSTRDEVEIVVFEFGAVLVAYHVALEGGLESAVELATTLLADSALLEDSRKRVDSLLGVVVAHCLKPGLSPLIEDYHVFRFPEAAIAGDAEAFVAANEGVLARVLRGETRELSKQEISEALSVRLQYEPNDLALIDWNAALLFDDQPHDVLRVFEYANTQLLELRFLDAQLDRALERAWGLLSRRRHRILGPFALKGDLDRVAAMQVDAALLYERVGNTLKYSGDPYLARVLRGTSASFGLQEWNETALRKLGTLSDIYEKIHDHASGLRAEFLEVLIVALIVFEIVLSFVHR